MYITHVHYIRADYAHVYSVCVDYTHLYYQFWHYTHVFHIRQHALTIYATHNRKLEQWVEYEVTHVANYFHSAEHEVTP